MLNIHEDILLGLDVLHLLQLHDLGLLHHFECVARSLWVTLELDLLDATTNSEEYCKYYELRVAINWAIELRATALANLTSQSLREVGSLEVVR